MVSYNYAVVTMLALLCSYSPTLRADDEQCTSGFLDLDSIDENPMSDIVALPDTDLSNGGLLSGFRRWIFPNINFTCDGYITSWILRVNNSMPESMDTALIPQTTTWRPLAGSNFYTQQNITSESQLTSLKIGTQMIEYTPSPPGIPVQAGDIVGIRLPSVDDDQLMIKSIFLRLPQGNSSTISCIGLEGQFFFFDSINQRCMNNVQGEEQSLYIPLISANINTGTPLSVSSSATTAPTSSTPPATTTMAPTPLPTDSRTTPEDSTSGLTSINMDLAAPPQSGSGANSGQRVLVGGVISVIAALALFLIVLTIFLVLLTKRREKKLYSTVSAPPQPQTDIDSTINSQIIDSQGIEVKNNEAYSSSTTQQIPTEDNVAYGPLISTVDNAAYGQVTSQIPTEDNVAYGQAAASQQQISTEDNVAYGHAISQIPTEDNMAYGQLVLQIPTEDKCGIWS